MKTKNQILFEKLKKECKKAGTFCPKDHIVCREVANTPVWLRLFFKLDGEAIERERILKIINKWKENETDKDCKLDKDETDCLPCYVTDLLEALEKEIKK